MTHTAPQPAAAPALPNRPPLRPSQDQSTVPFPTFLPGDEGDESTGELLAEALNPPPMPLKLRK